jgi:pimeloyl-ACP methyl ester carboxylesterase
VTSGDNYSLKGYPSILNDISDWRARILSRGYEISYKKQINAYLSLYPTPSDWRKLHIDLATKRHQQIYFSPLVLEGIKIPVMLVLGDHDDVTLEHGIEMFRLIKPRLRNRKR